MVFKDSFREAEFRVQLPIMCPPNRKIDVNSLANYEAAVTKHTDLELKICFDQSIITGTTEVSIEALAPEGLSELVLDTSNLKICDVSVSEKPTQWELKPMVEPHGSPLHITLDRTYQKGQTFTVKASHVIPHRS